MTKTLTIRVKSLHEALEGFRTTFKAVAAGQRVVRREGVYFASIEAARNLLTPTRLALLRVIRDKRPGSIYELAKLVGRNSRMSRGTSSLSRSMGLCERSSIHPRSHYASSRAQVDLEDVHVVVYAEITTQE